MAAIKEFPLWRQMLIVTVALSVIYFGFISLLLGQAANQAGYLRNMAIAIQDFDGGVIGASMIDTTNRVLNESSPIPGYTITSEFENIDAVRAAVADGVYWGAIVANKDASANLQSAVAAAVANSTANYTASLALTFIYDEGRNPQVASVAVIGPGRGILARMAREFAPVFLRTNSAAAPSLLRFAPQVLLAPVAFTEENLHPNTAPVLAFALGFGNVFLMVFSIVTAVLTMNMTKIPASTLTPVQTLSLRLRLIIPLVIVISVLTSTLLTVFGVRWPSAATFVEHWWLCAFTMLPYIFLFFTLFSLINIGAPPPVLVILILWIILNVVSGVTTVELAHPFYRFAIGFVIWNHAAAARTIIFGSYNRLGTNLGVIAAWLAFWFLLYLVIQLSGREKKALEEFVKKQAEIDAARQRLLDEKKAGPGVEDEALYEADKTATNGDAMA